MSFDSARAVATSLSWTTRVRPMVLGAFMADVAAPQRRTIVTTAEGTRYFIDPLNQLGQSVIMHGIYEADTRQILRDYLPIGGSFLDVGANEGYFTVLAGCIVGPSGYIAAVEPQSRLSDIIEINIALNGVRANVFRGALGGAKGEQTVIFLSPSLNTGYSSVISRPHFTRSSESAAFTDPIETLGSRPFFDLVKVDVEGFEDEVVESLIPMLEQGKIHNLLLDYHAPILQAKGTDPANIERKLLKSGMTILQSSQEFSGFRLYGLSTEISKSERSI